jgi:uncharacterized membrane protein YsdA (DUF1294 family)
VRDVRLLLIANSTGEEAHNAKDESEIALREPAKGEQRDMMIAAVGYLIVVAVMSLVCFITYGLDKRQAVKGGHRVSERTLHLMAFLGGWPGALIGQRKFHHKMQKVAFRIMFWMVVVIHIGIVGAVAYAVVT